MEAGEKDHAMSTSVFHLPVLNRCGGSAAPTFAGGGAAMRKSLASPGEFHQTNPNITSKPLGLIGSTLSME
ncbi:hypothetical protein MCP1_140017 [Candidatus Terasakiella magnetica]|nr:hypothetical protein MCP1_140017 [Candidatus Terasakiella magnetica]